MTFQGCVIGFLFFIAWQLTAIRIELKRKDKDDK